MKRDRVPEPWMFGVEVRVGDRVIQGEPGRFTLLARARMAWRVFNGRPALNGIPADAQEDTA